MLYSIYYNMNSLNHGKDQSYMNNVSRPSTSLPFPLSKQIISITIIALFSLSMIMLYDTSTLNKNIAFAQNGNNQSVIYLTLLYRPK